MICEWRWLGQVEYSKAWAFQERLAGEVASTTRPPTLLLLEHPHTYTLGRRANRSNLLWDAEMLTEKGVTVHTVDRGGDVTYHGPGQLVGYPIIPLAAPGWQSEHLPQVDFTGYLRKLEKLLIITLADCNIAAGRLAGKTGVWVSPNASGRCPHWRASTHTLGKVASIGVKVDVKGVTRHGFALNLNPDQVYWNGIIPCGLDGVSMVSIADLVPETPKMPLLAASLAVHFGAIFNYEMKNNPTLTP